MALTEQKADSSSCLTIRAARHKILVMHLRIILLALLYSALSSLEIEMFFDWMSDAKGQTVFPLSEGTPSETLHWTSLLRRKLRDRGDEIRSWEIEAYQPWLISWKEIQSLQDAKHWLRFDLPRTEAILPSTKCWIFSNLGPKLRNCNFSRFPKEKLVLIMWEPPTVQKELHDPKIQSAFGKIFTWDDDLVDNQKFFKFYYPVLKARIEQIVPFEEKKFCVMIARRLTSRHPKELYSQRKATIQFFEGKPDGEFDLYGFYWKPGKYKNWRGPLNSDKIEKLKEYKFSICYENMSDVKGYITEKIFDCFTAGVVPVYWGASNITQYIPANCFIDRRRFANEEEMYQFLKAISNEEYQTYLDHAADFLKSDSAKLFTAEHFVKTLLSNI